MVPRGFSEAVEFQFLPEREVGYPFHTPFFRILKLADLNTQKWLIVTDPLSPVEPAHLFHVPRRRCETNR